MQDKKSILVTAAMDNIDVQIKGALLIDFVPFISIENTLLKKENSIIELTQSSIKAIITSNNAALFLIDFLSKKKSIPAWQFFCINFSTEKIIADYFGQKSILKTAATAKELNKIIAQDGSPKEKLYFFCGNKKSNEWAEDITPFEIENIEIYQTILTPKKIEKQYTAILFFSPSAIESFFMLNAVSPETLFFVIGPSSFDYLKSYNLPNQIIQNTQMGKANLVQQTIQYLDKKNNYN